VGEVVRTAREVTLPKPNPKPAEPAETKPVPKTDAP
jgi:hypothetical protein